MPPPLSKSWERKGPTKKIGGRTRATPEETTPPEGATPKDVPDVGGLVYKNDEPAVEAPEPEIPPRKKRKVKRQNIHELENELSFALRNRKDKKTHRTCISMYQDLKDKMEERIEALVKAQDIRNKALEKRIEALEKRIKHKQLVPVP